MAFNHEINKCEYLTEHQIDLFSMMNFLKAGALEEAITQLSEFGKTKQEITNILTKHIESCWHCKDTYKDKEFLNKGIFDSLKEPKPKDVNKILDEFETTHIKTGYPKRDELRKYLTEMAAARANKQPFLTNKEYEEHSLNCKNCLKLYILELAAATSKKISKDYQE